MSAFPFVPHAERKLDGARFFLTRLEESTEYPRAFYHYATSILTCLRSVDYALRNEHGERYKAWYEEWLANLPEQRRRLVGDIKYLRNADVHDAGTPMTMEVEVHSLDSTAQIIAGFSLTGIITADIEAFWPRLLEGGTINPTGVRADASYRFSAEGEPADVITQCREFIDLVEELINEFRRTGSE